MYASIVGLYAFAQEFHISRGEASLPYTLFMLGFGAGGVAIGRISDRVGIFPPVVGSAFALALSLYLSTLANDIFFIALTSGLMAGFLGSAATFGPLVADISHWFNRRRGIAVAVVISGNYVAGTIWPPILQRLIDQQGWRTTFTELAVFVVVTMLPLSLMLLRKSPITDDHPAEKIGSPGIDRPGLAPWHLQSLLCVAGIGCCVAMAMPQVHIVAYAADLGYGATAGAQMLSLMLGFGIVSRLGSGWISDKIGGLKTLMLGSALQGTVLALFLTGNSLFALYLLSALFGLAQGGIVPSYTIIVRTFFSARDAGWRVGLTMLFTMIGMAFGGWLAGGLYDLTGSYTMAFVNAIAFNVLNFAIAVFVFRRMGARPAAYAV